MKTNYNSDKSKEENKSVEQPTETGGKDHGFLWFLVGMVGLVIALVIATKLITWLMN